MVHNDWDYHDPGFSRLVEVFQACRGNYESETCFRQYSDGTATGTFMLDGLRRGHRFGLIASSDHGHGASYVAVLARSLSRAEIFEALWSRRTCAATTRGVLAVLRLGPAPDGRGARVARCPAADRARPRLHRARPDRHPAGRPGRARAARRAAAAAGTPPGRPQGGMGAGGHDDLLGRAAVGGGRPARAARPRRPRGRGHGLPRRAVAARHAQLRRALRGAARWRRGQRLRPGRRAADRRLRGPVLPDRAGRAGRTAGPRPVRARRTSRVAPAGSPSSPPSAPCSDSAPAPSTSPSATTSR